MDIDLNPSIGSAPHGSESGSGKTVDKAGKLDEKLSKVVKKMEQVDINEKVTRPVNSRNDDLNTDKDEVKRWMEMEYQTQLLKYSPDCFNDTLFNGCSESLVAFYAELKQELVKKDPTLDNEALDKAFVEHRKLFEPSLHRSFDKLKPIIERMLCIPADVVLESDQPHLDHAQKDCDFEKEKLKKKIAKKEKKLIEHALYYRKLREELEEIRMTQKVLDDIDKATELVDEIKSEKADIREFVKEATACMKALEDTN